MFRAPSPLIHFSIMRWACAEDNSVPAPCLQGIDGNSNTRNKDHYLSAPVDPLITSVEAMMVQKQPSHGRKKKKKRDDPFVGGRNVDSDPLIDCNNIKSSKADPPEAVGNRYLCIRPSAESNNNSTPSNNNSTPSIEQRDEAPPSERNEIVEANILEDRDVVEAVMRRTTHVFEERDEFQLAVARECFENGTNYWGNGEHDIAMIEFRRALEINEEIYGRVSQETAKCYLWVGSIHWHKEEYDRALDCFCRSFRIRMQLAGFVKKNCGIVVSWIDRVLKAKNVEKPSKYWKTILQAIERERMGDKLMNEGNYAAAITEYRAVIQLELSRRGLKANSPGRPISDVADLHSKIAQVHVAQKDYARAMMEYRQALSIYTSAFGRDQQFTTRCYKDIGVVAQLMGFRDSAINSYLDTIHECLVDETYADHFMEEKNYEAALKYYEGIVLKEGVGVGMHLIQSALILAKTGRALRKLGRKEESIPNFCKAYGIFNDILGSEHRLTRGALKVIRETLIETK